MVHSSNNLPEERRRGRQKTTFEIMEALCSNCIADDEQNVPFCMGELRKAQDKTGRTAPGKDETSLCHSMYV